MVDSSNKGAVGPTNVLTGEPVIGVLGCGNMGLALVRALVLGEKREVVAYDADPKAKEHIRSLAGVQLMENIEGLLTKSDVLILAVKPQVFASIAPSLKEPNGGQDRLLISIMAGITSESIRLKLGNSRKVIRVMPNLPLSVGEGLSAIESDGHDDTHLALVEKVFGAAGKTVRVTSSQMDAVTGLSGSGPMYVFEFLEGLILAGVKQGLAREVSTELVLQTVAGSLKLLAGSDSPSQWSARVCSPGGTTIHALHELEKAGFKGSLITAVDAAVKRSRELST